MTKVEKLIKLIIDEGYGRGWWYSIKKKKLIEINPNDLGPQGDHNIWIGVGSNARKLGIDPRKAKAFQQCKYGFDVDKDNPLYKYSYNGFVDTMKRKPPVKQLDNYFKNNFGMSYSKAQSIKFPDLIKIRWWEGFILSFVLPTLNDKCVSSFIHILSELIKILHPNKNVKVMVSVYDTGKMYTMNLEDALYIKCTRDFNRY